MLWLFVGGINGIKHDFYNTLMPKINLYVLASFNPLDLSVITLHSKMHRNCPFLLGANHCLISESYSTYCCVLGHSSQSPFFWGWVLLSPAIIKVSALRVHFLRSLVCTFLCYSLSEVSVPFCITRKHLYLHSLM